MESDTDTTRVDLATDFRLMAALQTDEGMILADPELAANKTLALFGRAEARDYIDLQALAQRFSLTELCGLAASKDDGFTPPLLADALAQRFSLTELCGLAASKDDGFTPPLLADALDYIEQRRREDFDLDDAAYHELVNFAKSAAGALRQLDRGPHQRGLDDPDGISLV